MTRAFVISGLYDWALAQPWSLARRAVVAAVLVRLVRVGEA